MTDQWYFARDGKTSGPFSAARLQELAAAGEVRPQDAVWKEGMDRRVLASKVKGLFAASPAPAPPPPAPAAEPPPPPPPEAAEEPAPPPEPEPEPAEQAEEPAAPAEADKPEPPPEEKFTAPPQPTKVFRVLSIKGGVIASQDGTIVKFRKKCLRCGYGDTSLTTMRIRSGTTRVNFFCPKCRKSQLTEVNGVG
jgi:hypothetical protein